MALSLLTPQTTWSVLKIHFFCLWGFNMKRTAWCSISHEAPVTSFQTMRTIYHSKLAKLSKQPTDASFY